MTRSYLVGACTGRSPSGLCPENLVDRRGRAPKDLGHVGAVGVYFQSITGTKFRFVPYRGAGPAMQDLVAGQIDIMIDQAANSIPQVRAGTIKAYAVTDKTRLAAAPDIPTVDEEGVPGLHISIWHALWMPKARRRKSSPNSMAPLSTP